MNTRTKLQEKIDEEKSFHGYPAHKILAVIDSRENTESAINALTAAGVGEKDIEVYYGQSGARAIDFSGAEHGLWGRFIRTLQHFGEESKYLDRYENELLAGHFLVMAQADDETAKERIAEILRSRGGHEVNYFGYLTFGGVTEKSAGKVQTTRYAYRRELEISFGEAVERARAALKTEGFGVLCEIDVRATFREKLGVEFPEYLILGACSPPSAFEALREEIELGLLLPCNVAVYAKNGGAVVAAIDAAKMLAIVGNPKLAATARTINEKLRRVIDAI